MGDRIHAKNECTSYAVELGIPRAFGVKWGNDWKRRSVRLITRTPVNKEEAEVGAVDGAVLVKVAGAGEWGRAAPSNKEES